MRPILALNCLLQIEQERSEEESSVGDALALGVVGWCEGAVYLTSLGRPTDIGLQLGKACYPCSG